MGGKTMQGKETQNMICNFMTGSSIILHNYKNDIYIYDKTY